jgi:hypothetical protein
MNLYIQGDILMWSHGAALLNESLYMRYAGEWLAVTKHGSIVGICILFCERSSLDERVIRTADNAFTLENDPHFSKDVVVSFRGLPEPFWVVESGPYVPVYGTDEGLPRSWRVSEFPEWAASLEVEVAK